MRTRYSIVRLGLAAAIVLSLSALQAPGLAGERQPRPEAGTAAAPGTAEVTVYTDWDQPVVPNGELRKVAGQDVEISRGSGVREDPFEAEVSLPNAIVELATDDLEVGESASAELAAKADFAPVEKVALPPGATKKVYILVTSEDFTEHYLLRATRAATLSGLEDALETADELIGSGRLDSYTPESVRAFYRVVEAARETLASTPDQIQVDNGRKAILDIIAALDPLDPGAMPAPPVIRHGRIAAS
jgi:hypothetical protein